VIDLPVYWVEVAIVISRAEAAAQEKLAKLRKMEADAFGGFSGSGRG
jgi:hypothetical protein